LAVNVPPNLGTDPFELEADAQLVHLLADRFYEDEGVDLGDDRVALLRLLQAARSARRELATADHAEVSIPFIATGPRGQPLSLNDTITRRDQRQAQANEGFWDTLDKLEAILFEQGAQPAQTAPGQTAVPLTGDYQSNLPVVTRGRPWGKYIVRALAGFAIFLTIAIGWLALTAPLSKSLQPPTPPSITLLADDGKTPIARRGAIIGAPVDAEKLPPHVTEAFLAIEDRRFYSHWGVDPRGIARAVWHNATSDGRNQGGSTITQQLAKNAFLDSDRTIGRKLREVMIAFWLEGWLTKNEILSRYLSNVYFGDNVYGLQAAAKHYFGRDATDLTVGQAAMLAGLVKAPSRLNPTDNLPGARARAKVVVAAMEDAGFLTPREADAVVAAKPRRNIKQVLPTGTYFADWVLPAARDQAGEIKTEAKVVTTLDRRMQAAAERSVRRAGLRQAQVAIVAMRPDGRVVAMVGGKNYADSPFNRATQARRQPGSAFKLFVYLAALRSGMTPDTLVDDSPIDIAGWKPKNSDGRYLGKIPLRRAFARSSNVAAVRLIQQVGVRNVIRAARDLGISTPLPNEATIALGTNTVSLLELTAAYAAIANGRYPVPARGIEDQKEKGWIDTLTGGDHAFDGRVRDGMLELLRANVAGGTGHSAALSVESFGKTGTTQDNRDALFVGFAEDLVVGVWVGNDDNTPNPGLMGGGLPARIWKDFMMQALRVGPAQAPAPEPTADAAAVDYDAEDDPVANIINGAVPAIQGQLEGLGLNLTVGRDGSISVTDRDDRAPLRRRRDPRDQPPDGPPDPLDRPRRE
jgi:penicillin-binding protein 1A